MILVLLRRHTPLLQSQLMNLALQATNFVQFCGGNGRCSGGVIKG